MKPLSGDPLNILLDHNTWAFRAVLDACRPLAPEQFHRDFGIGPGSLHDNLTHSLGVMLRWIDRVEGRPLRPRIDGRAGPGDTSPVTRRTVNELHEVLSSAAREWTDLLPSLRTRLADTREITFPGSPTLHRFSIAGAIVHLTNHGVHHRTQCVYMLKQLGAKTLPDLDEITWQTLGEP